jgi:hypothetical protein
MKHSVSTKVLQDILNYLASRPYSEVTVLIKTLQEDAKPIAEESAPEVIPEVI